MIGTTQEGRELLALIRGLEARVEKLEQDNRAILEQPMIVVDPGLVQNMDAAKPAKDAKKKGEEDGISS